MTCSAGAGKPTCRLAGYQRFHSYSPAGNGGGKPSPRSAEQAEAPFEHIFVHGRWGWSDARRGVRLRRAAGAGPGAACECVQPEGNEHHRHAAQARLTAPATCTAPRRHRRLAGAQRHRRRRGHCRRRRCGGTGHLVSDDDKSGPRGAAGAPRKESSAEPAGAVALAGVLAAIARGKISRRMPVIRSPCLRNRLQG